MKFKRKRNPDSYFPFVKETHFWFFLYCHLQKLFCVSKVNQLRQRTVHTVCFESLWQTHVWLIWKETTALSFDDMTLRSSALSNKTRREKYTSHLHQTSMRVNWTRSPKENYTLSRSKLLLPITFFLCLEANHSLLEFIENEHRHNVHTQKNTCTVDQNSCPRLSSICTRV
jgi:hypothetical protein